jgi:hypothetical protein
MRYAIIKVIDVVFNSPVDVEISDDVMMFLDTQTYRDAIREAGK